MRPTGHEPTRRVEPEQRRPPDPEQPGGKPRRVWPRVLFGVLVFLCLFAGIYGYWVYQWQLDLQTEIIRQAEKGSQAESARPSEREAQISALLSGAKADLSANRLTSPAGNNAWEKYQAVLKLAPGHIDAQKGMDNVIARYKSMFDSALRRKKFAEAQRYVSQIRSVHANAPGLSEIENRLSASRADEKRRQEAQKEKLKRIRQEAAARKAESNQEKKAGRKFRDCEVCPEMVVVPAGALRPRWGHTRQTLLVCTTYWAMCGNGRKIVGMITIPMYRVMGLPGNQVIALCACCVAVHGSAAPGFSARRIASGRPPSSGTAASVFELPGLFKS